jgi:hypothetical protein
VRARTLALDAWALLRSCSHECMRLDRSAHVHLALQQGGAQQPRVRSEVELAVSSRTLGMPGQPQPHVRFERTEHCALRGGAARAGCDVQWRSRRRRSRPSC